MLLDEWRVIWILKMCHAEYVANTNLSILATKIVALIALAVDRAGLGSKGKQKTKRDLKPFIFISKFVLLVGIGRQSNEP